jgi:NADPH:quinone reductase-like Zn-dependent oxidoreductase
MTDPDSSATAFWTVASARGELRSRPLGPLAPGRARVRTLFGGISRGTETLVFRGEVPESEFDRMRCPLQEGDFPFPVKYGYAAVGQVDSGPPDLQGRTVFCLHPHQDRFDAPTDMLVPLPGGLPPRRAVLGANMETALNALWDARPCLGDRIAVAGAGVVGCLVARLAAQIPGTQVTLIDPDPAKAAVAHALGLRLATPETAAETLADACDLVVHASGAPAGLGPCLALARFEASVMELSWYGDRQVPLPLGRDFHVKRLTLASSQVGSVAAARRPRRTHRDRLAQALELLCDPAFEALLDGEVAFADLPREMARLAEGAPALCRVIRYD